MQPAPSDASVSWDRDSLLVDLALQGGGAHGAYTWGVLDRLLEQPWLQVDGIFRHLGRRHERRRTGLWTFPGWERRCPHRVGDRLATRIRGGSVQCCASLYLHPEGSRSIRHIGCCYRRLDVSKAEHRPFLIIQSSHCA